MRLFSLFPLLASLCFLAALPARAQAFQEIPVQFSKGYLWLEVSVPGVRKPLYFVLDSGAAASILNLPVARRLGLQLGRQETVRGVHAIVPAFRVDHFQGQSGGIRLPESLLAVDFKAMGIAPGRPIDGLLGMDFFQGRIVQIDYAAQKVRLLDRAEVKPTSQVLPITLRNRCLSVPVNIAGRASQSLRVDTGCDSSVEWCASDSKATRARALSVGLAGSSARGLCSTTVRLGERRFDRVIIGVHAREIFPGEAGLLGNALLSQFKVTLDTRGKRLILD